MLYNFLYPLSDQVALFNLFKYLTFRTGGAVLTAMVYSFMAGPAITASRSAPTARKAIWSRRERRPWAAS
jgi:hypothetical protein